MGLKTRIMARHVKKKMKAKKGAKNGDKQRKE